MSECGAARRVSFHAILQLRAAPAALQMVNISLRVLSKPDTHLLSQIFRSLGVDWDERVLPSIGNEILKSVVAQYNAEQLLTQRDRVSRGVSPLCFTQPASAESTLRSL